tara:strand:- start:5664 stop:5909 length:246 start_codon:yes stop_codon:yes gene_type:complete
MDIINLDDFLDNQILKEKSFREKIENTDWDKYSNKKILIKGCSQATIPTWAYMIIASKLTKHAKSIYYGEQCSAIKIYSKN